MNAWTPKLRIARSRVDATTIRVAAALGAYALVYMGWLVFHWGGPAHRSLIGDGAILPVNLAGVILSGRRALQRGLSRRDHAAWWFICAGLFAYLMGDAVQTVYEGVYHNVPYPSLSDACYLAFYPLMLVGVLRLPRSTRRRTDRPQLWMDGLAMAFAGAAVAWYIFFTAAANSTGSTIQEWLSIAYPCGDLVLIFAVSVLLVTRASTRSGFASHLLALSLIFFIAADLIYGRMALTNSYQGGDPVDLLWMAALALMALGASACSVAPRTHAATDMDARASEGSTAVAYVAIATTFVLLVAGVGYEGRLMAGLFSFTVAAVVVVLARLQWSSVDKRRQRLYYMALVERVSDYIVVLDRDFAPTYASPALLELVGLPANSIVDASYLPRFVVEDDVPLVVASLRRATATPSGESRADVRITDASGTTRHVVGVTTNLLDDPAVAGLVVVLHDVTENVQLEGELRTQALHDALTGLPNRALVNDRLNQMVVSAQRRNSSVAVLFIDLDDFKDVNDSLGHAAGDELLRAVGSRLDSLMRGQDTVGRIGGDEFVLLADVANDVEGAIVLARRVIDLLVEPFLLDCYLGRPIRIGASIGIACGANSSPTHLLRDADLALYRAKATGKNRFVVFEPEMHERASTRLELENDLSVALERGEFFLLYQPVIALGTLQPNGVEALHPLASPDARGHRAPRTSSPCSRAGASSSTSGDGSSDRRACRVRVGSSRGCRLHVGVNASALQLIDPGFEGDVRRALVDTGFDPSRLVVEITESVLMREPLQDRDRAREPQADGAARSPSTTSVRATRLSPTYASSRSTY